MSAQSPSETTEAAGVEQAVEELIDQVGTQTDPDPLLHVEELRGKVAIVTGGSSGIGRATALTFARLGLHIGFNYLDDGSEASRAEAHQVGELLRELEVRVLCRPCDVRESAQVNAFVEEVHEELGGLHILVNNAGVARDRALWRMADDQWQVVVETNLSGAFHFIRAVAPYLRAQDYGKIVSVTSIHALRAEFGLANYSASKAGIIGLTRAAAVELGPSNVNVNAVAPGYIRTTRLTDSVPAEIIDRAREKSALRRLGDPQDVANVISFLCTEAARHITGAVIPVDGGYLL